MGEPNGKHPDSDRVEAVPEGDAILVCTPCHGHRVLFPIDEAVAGARLDVICLVGAEVWLVDLVADGQAETGLRPVWTQAKPEAGQ